MRTSSRPSHDRGTARRPRRRSHRRGWPATTSRAGRAASTRGAGRAEQSPLRCIERDGEGAEHAGGDQRGRAQVRDRFVRRIQAERGDADQRERHLRERLHRRADRDGCRRVGHPRAALREVAHHQHRAADLPGGQQAVHRFADPARAQRIAGSAPGWPGRNITEIATASIASGTTWNAATSAAGREERGRHGADALPGQQCDEECGPEGQQDEPARVMTRSCVASPVA